MLCLKQCHILILIVIETSLIFCAPQTDGYPYPSDDDDRVISHVIDPNGNGTELFSRSYDGTNNGNDHVISVVVDMNSSDTSKLFDRFNVSVEDVLRRINKQDQDNTQRNSEEIDSHDDQRDGDRDSVERG